MKQGWDGIEFLDVKSKSETKDTELETNKAFARTFETEEGKKVARLNGRKHFAVYEKRKEDSLPAVPIFSIFDNTESEAI